MKKEPTQLLECGNELNHKECTWRGRHCTEERKRFLDSKDKHNKDWKPLNLEIMRRFTLVGLQPWNSAIFPVEIDERQRKSCTTHMI